jgi:hypothetical protein
MENVKRDSHSQMVKARLTTRLTTSTAPLRPDPLGSSASCSCSVKRKRGEEGEAVERKSKWNRGNIRISETIQRRRRRKQPVKREKEKRSKEAHPL